MNPVGNRVKAALADWGSSPVFLQVGKSLDVAARNARDVALDIVERRNQLHHMGIREKFLVPLFLRNSVEFVTTFLALLDLGAIPVLAKMEYRKIELDEIFDNAKPQAVIAEKEHVRFLEKYLHNTIVIAKADSSFRLEQSVENLPFREDIPDDVASINYTYRGYGYPLGAMVSYEQYLHGARVLQEGLQGKIGERMLVILPMAHIFTMVGCVLVPLLFGMTSVIAETVHPRVIFELIRDLGVNYVTAVPEILDLFSRLHAPGSAFPSLKAFVSGGSTLTPESYDIVRNAFAVDLLHGYGLTEFTPVSRNARGQARKGTVGPLCDEVQCRIDDPGGSDFGEVLIKTPEKIGFYYRRPRESEEAHREGWFKTGDAGFMDKGHLVFVKELKNTRKVNGNMVDLEEIKRALQLDGDVQDAQVVLEDGHVCAKLAICQKIDFDEKTRALKSFLREILAEHKIPRKLSIL